MTEAKPNLEDLTRTIVLVYGMFDTGHPFWVFVAVKPSKYQNFLTAYKEGGIDLYHFEPFGEIIVSGQGRMPPDDITLKVAEMYQTDPAALFRSITREREEEDAQREQDAAP